MNRRATFAEVIPLSALKGSNMDDLPRVIARYLPQSPPHFPTDQVTDRSDEFRAAEIVREKLTRRLHQELPYGLTVGLEQFKEEDGRLLVNAVIWVERDGQKAIVIGQGGVQLKEVGSCGADRDVEAVRQAGAPGAVGEGQGELVGQRERAAPARLRVVTAADARRIQLQPAYVLHHRPYRDTSRILELFTRDHGRVSVFARGARGSRGKRHVVRADPAAVQSAAGVVERTRRGRAAHRRGVRRRRCRACRRSSWSTATTSTSCC